VGEEPVVQTLIYYSDGVNKLSEDYNQERQESTETRSLPETLVDQGQDSI
jgi:hypothetical protein